MPTILEFFKEDIGKARLWMNIPNPSLGDISPIDLVIMGRGEVLLKFIKAQIGEKHEES